MIPTVDDLRSDPLVHRFGDMFSLPGLTNFLGNVQADLDIAGIRSLNFPPFATSDSIAGCLFVDGKLFKSTGVPVTFTWYPDRIERTAEWDGLRFRSTTVLCPKAMASLVRLAIKNETASPRNVSLKFGLQGGVTQSRKAWTTWAPPTENDNEALTDVMPNGVAFRARSSNAFSCQAISRKTDSITPRSMVCTISLSPGEEQSVTFVHALGESLQEVVPLVRDVLSNPERQITRSREEWNAELRAVFTPGNDRYSGFLPSLETTDREILRLYHTGILGVICFKRDSPFSVIGRAYDTLLPKFWLTVTFLWDYSLSSIVHALLDPAVMRKYLELWMLTDIHTCFGTEYLTGGPVGPWYSVNDFAMNLMAWDYLRWTGDFGWLHRTPEGHTGAAQDPLTVRQYLVQYAENWRQFRATGGLADYGGILNLLECVSTYVHQIASLNAGNVFSMRFVADLLESAGESSRGAALRAEADQLVRDIQPLYADGKGYWRSRFPDGTMVDVHHCYDFFTVLNTIGPDLSKRQKAEMVEFCKREFHSPAWMHALSCDDDDAIFSVRPDHQWIGAYPAWPPQAVLALFRAGEHDFAYRWLKGLARSANQGPFGQAHFVETIIEPDQGGARKAPIDIPYMTDWTVSSGGSWVSAIIEGLFGVEASLKHGIAASPRFSSFDPASELKNLSYQGKLFHVTRKGIVQV